MNPEISGGAIAILRHMYSYRLKLNGDPTKDMPWFYLPTEVVARKTKKGSEESNQAKKTGVDAVDAPSAKYCRSHSGWEKFKKPTQVEVVGCTINQYGKPKWKFRFRRLPWNGPATGVRAKSRKGALGERAIT